MTVSPYDAIAEWYDTWVGSGSLLDDPFFPSVHELAGAVAGLRVCDLACGQGRVARQLADQGARVIGVDLSGRLLALARGYEQAQPRGIAYLQDDAQTLQAVRDAVFDGVICHLALMDIPDLVATIQAVYRVLRPGGWFIFSILHPCYNAPPSGEMATADGRVWRTVREYWAEGFWRSDVRPGPPGKVGAYHRTLSTYLTTLLDAGLSLEQVREPPATVALAERRPVWREVPAVLTARWRKGA